jgi:electron transfer flavoprotein beta subunit
VEIIVMVKQVPDTETAIKVNAAGTWIVEDDVKWIMNPHCEFAVEEGLRAKEKFGGTVTVVSVGPARAVEAIRTALAMGADKAVLVDDGAIWGASDSLGMGRILGKVIGSMAHDVIFCGKQAIDDDMAQVGSVVAEVLGIGQLTFVSGLEWVDGKTVRVTRQVEGGAQVLESGVPVLITCQKGLNEPRYASLPGIMKAKKKPLEVKNLGGLGMEGTEVGKAGEKTEILKVELPPARQAGKVIEGETPEEKAAKLAGVLRQEAKVI